MMNERSANGSSNAVNSWLRAQTITWSTPIPRHCLEGYGLEDGSLEEKYFGKQTQMLADVRYTPYFFVRAREEGNTDELEIVQAIRRSYAEQLTGGEKHKGYEHLLTLEEDLQRRAIDLANRINQAYAATDPKTGESTNIAEQADLLLEEIEASASEDTKRTLGSAYEIEAERQEWYVSQEECPKMWAAVQDLKDVEMPTERPCLAVQEMGYDCGFGFLPADLTIDTAAELVRRYVDVLQQDAINLKRTHELLCHRLQALQSVLREYSLYGEVSELDEEEVESIVSKGQNRRGREPKIKGEGSIEDRKDVVLPLLHDEECWHEGGRHQGKPKWEDIADRAAEEAEGLFVGNEQSYPDDHFLPLSGERIKQLVENEWGVDLQSVRKELGIPAPSSS